MDAIIRFLQDTGFYLFSQDGNWRCLIMLGIACVLLYLGIVKKADSPSRRRCWRISTVRAWQKTCWPPTSSS